MPTLNEIKYAKMLAETGATPPVTLNELEHLWLTLKLVPAGGTLNERWYTLFGGTGAWNGDAHAWLTLQGIPTGGTLNERFYQYWVA